MNIQAYKIFEFVLIEGNWFWSRKVIDGIHTSGILLQSPFKMSFFGENVGLDQMFECTFVSTSRVRFSCRDRVNKEGDHLKLSTGDSGKTRVQMKVEALRYTIASNDGSSIFIPLIADQKEHELLPKIDAGQTAVRKYVLWSAAVLLSIVVLNVILRSNELSQAMKVASTVSAALVVALPILGLTPKVRIQLPFRRILKSQRNIQLYFYCASVGILLGAMVLSHPITCLYKSYRYQIHLDRALANVTNLGRISEAAKAIEIFPERREAFEIVAKALNEGRYSDRISLSVSANSTLSNAAMMRNIVEFVSGQQEPCDCLAQSEQFLASQRQTLLVWLMFRTFETERYFAIDEDNYLAALSAVEDASDASVLVEVLNAVYALNLILNIDLQYRSSDTSAHVEALKAWISSSINLDPAKDDAFAVIEQNSYLAQLVTDRLFRTYLVSCDFTSARAFLAQLLTIRERSPDDAALWLEGAEKLIALHFMRSIRASDSTLTLPLYEVAYSVGQHLTENCPNWTKEEAEMLKQLKSDFPLWLKPDESIWRKGTVEGLTWGELETRLDKSKLADWRY